MNYRIQPTHISQIRPGDVVEVGGVLKTVGKSDLRKGFMGTTLWGDSYRLGALPVSLAVIKTPGYQRTNA